MKAGSLQKLTKVCVVLYNTADYYYHIVYECMNKLNAYFILYIDVFRTSAFHPTLMYSVDVPMFTTVTS